MIKPIIDYNYYISITSLILLMPWTFYKNKKKQSVKNYFETVLFSG